MTRAAWFYVGLTLLGFIAIAIGVGMLSYSQGSTAVGAWVQVAYGLLFVAAGVVRLVMVLRAARKSRAEIE